MFKGRHFDQSIGQRPLEEPHSKALQKTALDLTH